jgi:hypothetical protein
MHSPAQAAPHAPQFAGSDARSVQAFSVGQRVHPEGQPQAPFEQSPPVGQECPHVPQWWGSDDVSTQTGTLPHCWTPGLDVEQVHVPLEHEPAPQAMPHPPQFDGSVARSTHVPQ